MNNLLAFDTLQYIWQHPNSQNRQWQAISQFFHWQAHKRIIKRPWRYQLLPNLELLCYPNSYSAAAAIYCGLYDYDDMNFVLRYLRSNDSFLDVGANIGIYTLLAASRIETGTIHSFEALPKNYHRLEENIQLNHLKQVKTYPLAISDRPGTIQLNLAEGDSMPFITQEQGSHTITVNSDTLDNQLLAHVDERLTLGKMDIEGAELLALRGATRLMQRQWPKVWILEITDGIRHFGYERQDLIHCLSDFGYDLYCYRAQSNELKPLSLKDQTGKNVLAIAKDQLDFVHQRLSDIA